MIEKDWYVFDQKIKNIIFFSGYKWVYSCHEKTSHHNKTNMSLKSCSCTCVCTCLWWTHNFYGALHIIIDILKYIYL